MKQPQSPNRTMLLGCVLRRSANCIISTMLNIPNSDGRFCDRPDDARTADGSGDGVCKHRTGSGVSGDIASGNTARYGTAPGDGNNSRMTRLMLCQKNAQTMNGLDTSLLLRSTIMMVPISLFCLQPKIKLIQSGCAIRCSVNLRHRWICARLVRDVAGLLGGYGACGADRCCSSFLTVSARFQSKWRNRRAFH